MTFVTAGDPEISNLPEILLALERGGADIAEVGIPFSDPIADGPTIQASSQRALERGIKLADIFAALQKRTTTLPIVLMGYANTALRHGYDSFAKMAADAGASGVILSDLTPDEASPWLESAQRHSLDTVFLVAPTSTDERIALACSNSRGFVYCVSRTGVTGAANEIPHEVVHTVERIRKCTKLPVCIGFGISKPEHVRLVASIADGAVVGSHLVSFLHNHWSNGKGRDELERAVRDLKAATTDAS